MGKDNDILAGLDRPALERLTERIDAIRLFAHAYSHHLNMRLGDTTPADMLAFAEHHGLAGLNIHVDDGESRSLANMTPVQRADFGVAAATMNLAVHIEISSTTRAELEAAVAIAKEIGAPSIRCYPRYEGRLSTVIQQTIKDLRQLDEIEPAKTIQFKLEQHEDLKSGELAMIVRTVDNPRLSLLFDFGNMLNAHETPEAALEAMAPLLTEVHIKDVKPGDDRGGWSQIACKSGSGVIDFSALLCRLLLLGKDRPQITTFALQEENGMESPAFRFPDEGADPIIPWRAPSTTEIPASVTLADRLVREKEEAAEQVRYVRAILADLRRAAASRLATGADHD